MGLPIIRRRLTRDRAIRAHSIMTLGLAAFEFPQLVRVYAHGCGWRTRIIEVDPGHVIESRYPEGFQPHFRLPTPPPRDDPLKASALRFLPPEKAGPDLPEGSPEEAWITWDN
jgi:hypothetical protein